jgi:hypothetical protein
MKGDLSKYKKHALIFSNLAQSRQDRQELLSEKLLAILASLRET